MGTGTLPLDSGTLPVIPLRRRLVSGGAGWLIGLGFLIAVVPLVSLLWTVITRGLARLDWTFLSQTMRGVVGQGGGALHALAGTAMITGTSAAIAIPLGILTAIYLVEYGTGRLSTTINWLIDVMTGIPSIVAGLFAYAVLSAIAGPGARSGLAAAGALALLMVPVVIRSTEQILRLVSGEVREAALGLGAPQHRLVWRVVLPTAASGIIASAMLGIARVIGETAPLLLVAGFTDSLNGNLASGRMSTLPVFVYSQWQNKGANAAAYDGRAWSGALLLIALVLGLTLASKVIAALLAPGGRRRRPRLSTNQTKEQ